MFMVLLLNKNAFLCLLVILVKEKMYSSDKILCESV